MQSILIPSVSYQLTAETQAELNAIRGQVEQLARDAAASEQEADRLKATDAMNWTAEVDAAASRIRTKRAEHVHREIEIRTAISEAFDRIVSIDHPRACTAAYGEFSNAKRDIAAALRSIGYCPNTEGLTVAYYDGFRIELLCAHPRGKAARLLVDTLQGNPAVGDQRVANERAIEKCAAKLEAMKQDRLASIA